MPQLKKRRVLAFKIEATAGTAETLTDSECIWVENPEVQYDVPMNERFATGTLSRLKSISGARSAKVTFSTELHASGDSENPNPAWADLFLACGMVEADSVFTPTSNPSLYKTATIAVYQGPKKKALAGAMGTYTIEAASGSHGKVNWEFTGLLVDPSDATMLALPEYAITPPRFAGATFTINSVAKAIANFSLTAGNTIKLIEDITKASGYNRALVTDRAYGGSIDPEAGSVASDPIWAAWLNSTEYALNLSIGSGAGNIVTIAAPKFQYANVQEGDREGLEVNNIDYQLNGSSDGDDELSITFA